MKFEEFGLSKEVLSGLELMKFQEASPIQEQAIKPILEGFDLIGQAQTGTGKTAAFGIPVIEKLQVASKMPQVLVLCPTRELAIQIAEQLKNIAKFKNSVQVLALYGGQNIDTQFKLLKRGANVVVATPGRLLDHLRRGSIKLKDVRTLILDEVDEMLNIGFKKDLEEIFERIPAEQKQTIFFSATISEHIMGLAKKYLKNPKFVKTIDQKASTPNIEQFYLEVKERAKPSLLTEIISKYNLNFSLVFCNTKRGVDELVRHLNLQGYFANGLHGDMRQSQRDRVMRSFKKGETRILVATDVAARGIDMTIEAVFNYDIPQATEHYVHRIGRTGRAGRKGKAFTFFSRSQVGKLKSIKNGLKLSLAS